NQPTPTLSFSPRKPLSLLLRRSHTQVHSPSPPNHISYVSTPIHPHTMATNLPKKPTRNQAEVFLESLLNMDVSALGNLNILQYPKWARRILNDERSRRCRKGAQSRPTAKEKDQMIAVLGLPPGNGATPGHPEGDKLTKKERKKMREEQKKQEEEKERRQREEEEAKKKEAKKKEEEQRRLRQEAEERWRREEEERRLREEEEEEEEEERRLREEERQAEERWLRQQEEEEERRLVEEEERRLGEEDEDEERWRRNEEERRRREWEVKST
ncbi:hypothetical protein B0O80DRAFT_523036, partial [Mortierella sp. GBAus27b]